GGDEDDESSGFSRRTLIDFWNSMSFMSGRRVLFPLPVTAIILSGRFGSLFLPVFAFANILTIC
ncbi:hypothetical protein L195_g061340, partial [Trifolium pratense]